MKRVSRIVFALTTGLLASHGLAGCAEDCNEVEPAYAGDATDEAWRVMLDARASASAGDDQATFTSPGDDDSLDESPTFAWDSPLKVTSSPSFSPSSFTPVPGHRRTRSFVDAVSQALLPMAHAHLPPVTGDVYLLEVDVPGRSCPVAGFTTQTSFTFSADDWSTILGGGGTSTVRLMSAFLAENRITEGPFLAEPLTLRADGE